MATKTNSKTVVKSKETKKTNNVSKNTTNGNGSKKTESSKIGTEYLLFPDALKYAKVKRKIFFTSIKTGSLKRLIVDNKICFIKSELQLLRQEVERTNVNGNGKGNGKKKNGKTVVNDKKK